jgi:Zn-dependent peptidase ImmA (M78 family)
MTTRRQELLRATTEAALTLDHFPVGQRSSFDIVGAVTALDIPLIFRPLKNLWGATVTIGNDLRGVLITTILDLHVQRFTLAHELGHVLLGHELSLDKSVGFKGRFSPDSQPLHELAANVFASELLASKKLMLDAARRHEWTRDALLKPFNVYQLGLRLGLSYQATCWGLAAQNVIPQAKAERLQNETLKEIKLSLAPADLIANPWSNVWKLTEGDSGSFLEAGPHDIFAVHLREDASAGFLWELVDAGNDGRILGERSNIDKNYGAATSRVVFLNFNAIGVHRLSFEHRRPWNNQRLAHIDIAIENYGKEQGGCARKVRELSLTEGA